MATSRRQFLAVSGRVAASLAVGATVAADGYAAHRGVFTSGSGPAYAPWQVWDHGTVPERLVRAAVLAANAHNAQAWLFTASARRIEVFEDTRRGLGTVDAYRREVHLSAGCAVENLAVAAGAAGLVPTVTLHPDGSTGLLATVDLAAGGGGASPLYRAIPLRHTDRGAYRTGRSMPADVIGSLDALGTSSDVRVQWLLDARDRAGFGDLTVAATEAFIADDVQSADDYAWYRSTAEQIELHRDGVTLDAGGTSPLLRSLGKVLPSSQAGNSGYWLAGTRDRQVPTAAGFGLLQVRDPADVAQRLAAGRLYQRLHLWATVHGLAMQPLNQVLERAEREQVTGVAGPSSRGLVEITDDPGWQPVMAFRIGYPTTPAPASPRRPLGAVLVAAR